MLKVNKVKTANKGEIAIYESRGVPRLEVRLDKDNIWMTQAQIAELFQTQRPAITKHLQNIFISGELEKGSVSSILEHTASDGKKWNKTQKIISDFDKEVEKLNQSRSNKNRDK